VTRDFALTSNVWSGYGRFCTTSWKVEGYGGGVNRSPEKSEGSASPAGSAGEDGAAATEPTGSAASDDVEIPQQQTAEKAADNEAGEGART
jgi:hypothetical protein